MRPRERRRFRGRRKWARDRTRPRSRELCRRNQTRVTDRDKGECDRARGKEIIGQINNGLEGVPRVNVRGEGNISRKVVSDHEENVHQFGTRHPPRDRKMRVAVDDLRG
jgi:hypothetical protein